MKLTKSLARGRQRISFDFHDFREKYGKEDCYDEAEMTILLDFIMEKLAQMEGRKSNAKKR